jgi:thioredoxin reductase
MEEDGMTADRLETFDAVVVGGGSAGLSAALALGRATRRVLVASCGPTRNEPSHAAHNIFTRDGTPPSELVRIGRDQLRPYDVSILDECAEDIRTEAAHYIVTFAGGREVRARGIVLASGVRDILPDIPGLHELWGTSVFHCPYCHGWEVAGRPLGIYSRGDAALHLSKLLRVWTSDLILFTDGPAELPDVDITRIRNNGIVVREDRVARLDGVTGLDAIVMANGEVIPRVGLFVSPKQELRSDLYDRLGCAVSADGRIQADALGRTNVPRVFVAGDACPGHQSVVSAAATGMIAGAGLNFDLAAEDFE